MTGQEKELRMAEPATEDVAAERPAEAVLAGAAQVFECRRHVIDRLLANPEIRSNLSHLPATFDPLHHTTPELRRVAPPCHISLHHRARDASGDPAAQEAVASTSSGHR